MFYGQFAPYVSVGERRRLGLAHAARLKKKGHVCSPVKIEGRAIATTFWGKAWCENLSAYSDYASRLPRGRTYARNGSVFDLQIAPGAVTALVSGSEIYTVKMQLAPVPRKRWSALVEQCAGSIDSVVELLGGRLSDAVMAVLCEKGRGLFPAPKEIELDCSCPDGAYLCKHLAAVLYGVGARLDHAPELLFTLRQVDHRELLGAAARGAVTSTVSAAPRALARESLADVFGIELESGEKPAAAPRTGRGKPPARRAKNVPRRKKVGSKQRTRA